MVKNSDKRLVNYRVIERRKNINDLQCERATVQVSIREKEILKLLAKKEGLRVSDYIRVKCIWEPYNKLTGGYGIE
ncbi:hypothetical protein H8S20_08110 [Clostridium sp. NSJ-6]|uniref:Uncharacterized protein n=1 Tax=Clostridium hominis TaxID=2763036 RepID=A0ABR7DBX9_9CLOT|nr:hypothetical protein [Clostridium hominis]MBC5628852.1 hypothetical protein [Clostridium hominis]